MGVGGCLSGEVGGGGRQEPERRYLVGTDSPNQELEIAKNSENEVPLPPPN